VSNIQGAFVTAGSVVADNAGDAAQAMTEGAVDT
jgi:hypothetical protein